MVLPATHRPNSPMTPPFSSAGAGAPLQHETDHGEGAGVVGGIAEKIECIRAQAYRPGDKAGHNLNEKHRDIYAERRPQYLPIARVGARPVAIVIAAGHFFKPRPRG